MKPFIEFVVQDDHNHSSYEAQLGCYSRYVNNCAKDGDADAVSFKIFDLRAEYDEAIIKRLALNGYSSAARIIDNNFENVTQDVIGDEIETAGTARVMPSIQESQVGIRSGCQKWEIKIIQDGEWEPPRIDNLDSRPAPLVLPKLPYQAPPPENDQECNKDLSWVYESSHVKYPSFSPIVSAGCSPVISSAQGNPEEIAKMNNL
ncbi:MAG: hypothetical protein J3Q66DRAFT_360523 [Benniella sp.]|nr:MAG: hypothetical protein J3Q66DRAFT_360508 [Benniella sp.]KAK3805632.1 MAG: hypothetical protein J3Q66DRAFT_360523 [Benniella sp.]